MTWRDEVGGLTPWLSPDDAERLLSGEDGDDSALGRALAGIRTAHGTDPAPPIGRTLASYLAEPTGRREPRLAGGLLAAAAVSILALVGQGVSGHPQTRDVLAASTGVTVEPPAAAASASSTTTSVSTTSTTSTSLPRSPVLGIDDPVSLLVDVVVPGAARAAADASSGPAAGPDRSLGDPAAVVPLEPDPVPANATGAGSEPAPTTTPIVPAPTTATTTPAPVTVTTPPPVPPSSAPPRATAPRATMPRGTVPPVVTTPRGPVPPVVVTPPGPPPGVTPGGHRITPARRPPPAGSRRRDRRRGFWRDPYPGGGSRRSQKCRPIGRLSTHARADTAVSTRGPTSDPALRPEGGITSIGLRDRGTRSGGGRWGSGSADPEPAAPAIPYAAARARRRGHDRRPGPGP